MAWDRDFGCYDTREEELFQKAMELIWDASDGDVESPEEDMGRLMGLGLDVNHVPEELGPDPLLFHAVRAKQYELAQMIILAGADVNALVSYSDETCIFESITKKDTRMIEILAKAGANLDARNTYGDTPRKLLQDENLLDVVECALADQERGIIQSALDGASINGQRQRMSRRM
ncbi:hypothetical protein [Sphingomonas sp.]|uniref:hypothetical protein n=1 Tax=Sphingomonas sp. TaxID=28214 RepID=UPI0025E24563|nr:hypothetical protein [Sphingomonas sp.]